MLTSTILHRNVGGTIRHFGTLGRNGRPRSFGFILPDGAETALFCHVKAISDPKLRADVRKGARVVFDIVSDPRGGAPICANVRPLPVAR